jgi:peptidoglycan/xylan/chitin deacetylase (PgdA/CDA1 family)
MTNRQLPILMFHSVGSPEDRLTIDRSRLADDLQAISEAGYALVGLTEALDRARMGDRVVGLTFDDAYRDFIDEGMPVLASVNARATLYAPAAHLGLPASWDAGSKTGADVLDAAGLREVVAAGHELGSHGNRHVPMDVLSDEVVAEEVTTAKRVLENVVQRDVPSFCYPHGYASARTAELVRLGGHANGCVIGYRPFSLEGDHMRVTRVIIRTGSSPQAAVELVSATRIPLEARAKAAATPAWRLVRRTAAAVRKEPA